MSGLSEVIASLLAARSKVVEQIKEVDCKLRITAS